MGERVILCGELHLSRKAFEGAQQTTVLELFREDPEDEDSFHAVAITARTLFSPAEARYRKWARNAYEAEQSRWILSASLHDDDWHDADPAILAGSLARLKDQDGTDLVVAFTEWNQELSAAWLIERGRSTPITPLPALPDEVRRSLGGGAIEKALAALRALFALAT